MNNSKVVSMTRGPARGCMACSRVQWPRGKRVRQVLGCSGPGQADGAGDRAQGPTSGLAGPAAHCKVNMAENRGL